MNRRSRHRFDAVDGLLLLNKPAGMTSNQALQKVRRLLNARKAGHTGALDPGATGMLPLCFGKATKVSTYLLDADKTYRVTAKLGIATDTGDADGREVERQDVPDMSREDWISVLQGFLGDSMQIPPMYSALKKDGKRLYELARKGEEVARDPRAIHIDEIELLEIAGPRLVFRVRCSKGTYVRTLVEDIARKAGTVAHTARLHRESIAGFERAAMLDMARIEALAEEGRDVLRAQLMAADEALRGLPETRLEAGGEALRFSSGQEVEAPPGTEPGLVRVYDAAGQFLGIGELGQQGRIAPRRVFSTAEKNP